MPAPALSAELDLNPADLERLWDGIEAHLAAHTPRPGIALPPVDQLIAQAGIATGPAWRQPKTAPSAPNIQLPGRIRSLLPRRRPRHPQHVTVTRHLELTAEVLERYGWARTGHVVATRTGRRCILGAQLLLLSLGVGSRDTLNAAAGHLNHVLRKRGWRDEYHLWNESPGRTYAEVQQLLTTATNNARKAGH